MQGQLFSHDFLTRGILETAPWQAFDRNQLDAFTTELRRAYGIVAADSALNEAQTESELIEPVLGLLGWENLPQINMSQSGREDVPDFLLFADAAAKARAFAEPSDDRRVRHGVALLEAKSWLRVLDRSEPGLTGTRKPRDFGAPSSQMLRYLSRADVMSDRAVKWGILTNGAVWRLYWQDARSRAEDFFEINLAALLGISGTQPELDGYESDHGLKLFYLLFGRAAFLKQTWDGEFRTYHAIALSEARRYEEAVSQSLGQRVFDEVFPALANALAASDLQAQKTARGQYTRAYLDEVREATLVLLYRMLFVLYAEDRALLPIHDPRYRDYSLRVIRDDIADKRDKGGVFSSTAGNYWGRLTELFIIISDGDDAVGMPAYNGGLFERARAPLLARVRVADAKLAPVIDALARRTEDLLRPPINYRDLSVSHLGGIYERLLEYSLADEGGTLIARPASFARKVSGSYYTHDDLVRLILNQSVGRLVDEQTTTLEQLLDTYSKRKSLKPYEWDALEAIDPAAQLLELKICDPAMGSGHFLVALVDWLADRVLLAMQEVDDRVNAMPWAAHLVDQKRPYASPVVARIADIRRRILATGLEHGWALDERQLDDRHIVRRMILKRVIFGVDKNPMAVELAKVALWLHTFTVGAPLSFLDHHLQCGDSLHGEQLDAVRQGLLAFGVMFQGAELDRLEIAAKSLEAVADLTDTSIAEAHESKRLADSAREQVAPIHGLLNFWRALRWLVPGWPDKQRKAVGRSTVEGLSDTQRVISELFSDRYNLVGVIQTGHINGDSETIAAVNALLKDAATLAREERFFHWHTAFPTVWRGSSGGFDAVIGNPPWDRIKLQEVEWLAERDLAIARQPRAADRKRLIAELEKKRAPLWQDYLAASERAVQQARVVRDSGDYPLLGGGDVNLYSLFVERATALVQPRGIVGLITPSGIAADKGASEFFRTLVETETGDGARLAALLDFENKKVFFPDIDSRFKFCALVFGGAAQRFAQAECAFFLHRVDELADPERVLRLSGTDFLRVNPNTGAAPIFRTRRDAELTTQIYARHPVLVNRSSGVEQKVWPLRYVTMFHMTNDSDKFITRVELEKQGWQRAPLNRWTKGEAQAVPLYVGRMIYHYDHRASSVTVNEENLHNAALSENLTAGAKADPSVFPEPQYWVADSDVPASVHAWALAFRDIARATDFRTMIGAIVPTLAAGNTLPFLTGLEASETCLMLANFNSLVFDYITRQKAQTTHLNWYIVEQLPVIAPADFEQSIGGVSIADFIRAEVLALTYTAHDMAGFARDLGYVDASGAVKPPFVWDADDRAHRMARLDALFMHLYGLSAADADYILSTFPIVREKDLAAFGSFRTRDWILAYRQRIDGGVLSHHNLDAPAVQ
ncbi:Eco57I restriction-modification methylase domain-containing protein [Thiobacillus denitrificans]|uniref:Eco57I restriction-modification methylase domain-containing protein n=1 Tax=Thiobacillus denitrificans TaxID=36861 RepID=UPI00075AB8ED|nr:hypothetical protein [Thiobacillus denitrificans]